MNLNFFRPFLILAFPLLSAHADSDYDPACDSLIHSLGQAKADAAYAKASYDRSLGFDVSYPSRSERKARLSSSTGSIWNIQDQLIDRCLVRRDSNSRLCENWMTRDLGATNAHLKIRGAENETKVASIPDLVPYSGQTMAARCFRSLNEYGYVRTKYDRTHNLGDAQFCYARDGSITRAFYAKDAIEIASLDLASALREVLDPNRKDIFPALRPHVAKMFEVLRSEVEPLIHDFSEVPIFLENTDYRFGKIEPGCRMEQVWVASARPTFKGKSHLVSSLFWSHLKPIDRLGLIIEEVIRRKGLIIEQRIDSEHHAQESLSITQAILRPMHSSPVETWMLFFTLFDDSGITLHDGRLVVPVSGSYPGLDFPVFSVEYDQGVVRGFTLSSATVLHGLQVDEFSHVLILPENQGYEITGKILNLDEKTKQIPSYVEPLGIRSVVNKIHGPVQVRPDGSLSGDFEMIAPPQEMQIGNLKLTLTKPLYNFHQKIWERGKPRPPVVLIYDRTRAPHIPFPGLNVHLNNGKILHFESRVYIEFSPSLDRVLRICPIQDRGQYFHESEEYYYDTIRDPELPWHRFSRPLNSYTTLHWVSPCHTFSPQGELIEPVTARLDSVEFLRPVPASPVRIAVGKIGWPFEDSKVTEGADGSLRIRHPLIASESLSKISGEKTPRERRLNGHIVSYGNDETKMLIVHRNATGELNFRLDGEYLNLSPRFIQAIDVERTVEAGLRMACPKEGYKPKDPDCLEKLYKVLFWQYGVWEDRTFNNAPIFTNVDFDSNFRVNYNCKHIKKARYNYVLNRSGRKTFGFRNIKKGQPIRVCITPEGVELAPLERRLRSP